MSISSVSFFQQDQNWQNQQQVWDQQLSNNNAFFSVMQTALTNQTTGLAGIANQTALSRVNSQIATLLNSGSSNGTTTNSSSSSTSNSAASSVTLHSSAVNLQSGATAASLLAGEIPAGSLLSVLA